MSKALTKKTANQNFSRYLKNTLSEKEERPNAFQNPLIQKYGEAIKSKNKNCSSEIPLLANFKTIGESDINNAKQDFDFENDFCSWDYIAKNILGNDTRNKFLKKIFHEAENEVKSKKKVMIGNIVNQSHGSHQTEDMEQSGRHADCEKSNIDFFFTQRQNSLVDVSNILVGNLDLTTPEAPTTKNRRI